MKPIKRSKSMKFRMDFMWSEERDYCGYPVGGRHFVVYVDADDYYTAVDLAREKMENAGFGGALLFWGGSPSSYPGREKWLLPGTEEELRNINKWEEEKEAEVKALIGERPPPIKSLTEEGEEITTDYAYGGWWGRRRHADGTVDGPVFRSYPPPRIINKKEIETREKEIAEYNRLREAIYKLISKSHKWARRGRDRKEINAKIREVLSGRKKETMESPDMGTL